CKLSRACRFATTASISYTLYRYDPDPPIGTDGITVIERCPRHPIDPFKSLKLHHDSHAPVGKNSDCFVVLCWLDHGAFVERRLCPLAGLQTLADRAASDPNHALGCARPRAHSEDRHVAPHFTLARLRATC